MELGLVLRLALPEIGVALHDQAMELVPSAVAAGDGAEQ
jgi:hypothetical protein